MDNVRIYGTPPFVVAVVHGGPGAAGGMAPVARELSAGWGIIEPLQTATSVNGQVLELKGALERNGAPSVTLIGSYWGAWLSFVVAARYPSLVKKLILVGCGPFEQSYAEGIMTTRLARMSYDARHDVELLLYRLESQTPADANESFAGLGHLLSEADSYDRLPTSAPIECRYNIYRSVWKGAAEMRRTGELLALAEEIRCSVVAIHGDCDPHPAEGVRRPLSRTLRDFRFVLLEKCGHEPWNERHAKDQFYEILRHEIS